jgi:hypothetical protein
MAKKMGAVDMPPISVKGIHSIYSPKISRAHVVSKKAKTARGSKEYYSEGYPLLPSRVKAPYKDGVSVISTVLTLYTSPDTATIMIPLSVLWFALCFGCYGLLEWIITIFDEIGLSGLYFSSLLFAAAELPGDVLSTIVIDKVGRVKLLFWSMFLAACSLVYLSVGLCILELQCIG